MVGGHLPAQTEFEWDKPDPIPVFVPVTGQIPGLADKLQEHNASI